MLKCRCSSFDPYHCCQFCFTSSLIHCTARETESYNWRAPWKNQIRSTSMKLRKSLISQWRGRIYRVVWFFHPRSPCTPHLMLFSESLPIYASSCITISGERTEQLDIFCRITGFTSDFCPPQTSADICVGHDDLWWRNRTTRCNRFWRAGCSRLEYIDIRLIY